MKRLIPILFLFSAFLLNARNAFAYDLCPRTGTYNNLCNLNLGSAIGNFVTFLYIIAIIAALFYLIWGGLKWLTSAGDKTALQGAREHIVAAIIGLIIIFLSYLILSFIGRFFLGPTFNLNNITVPSISGASVTEDDRGGPLPE